MSFRQFLFYQGVTFIAFFFASFLTAGGQDLVANLVMNFLTFFSSSWLITYLRPEREAVLCNVLSVTLSFNLVTYLLGYGAHLPLPSWKLLLLDFFLVAVYSILGVWAALKMRQQHHEH